MNSIPKFARLLVCVFPAIVSVPAYARPAVSDIAAHEVRQAEADLAAGGTRKLGATWYACLEAARASQNANTAERCILYGYGALRLTDAAAETPRMRSLSQDAVAQGQNEMLDIMGIPEAARQAWLERYRRLASENETTDSGGADSAERPSSPVVIDSPAFTPSMGEDSGGGRGIDLAGAADGKYPAQALRDPRIAGALRGLVGPSLFPRLRDYSFGEPMAFNGRYTAGHACEPRACGVSEARFVFSADTVWLGIIGGGRMRVYGDPPRQVLGLLMRGGNETVWRGPVDDVSHPPARLVPVAADQPRLTIAPRPLPISTDAVARPRPDGEATEIPLRRAHDSLVVPVLINDTLTVPFTIDSGASDVSISADVMQRLIESGTLTRADFQGRATYHLADGSRSTSDTFRLHSLRVGDREVHDVLASVTNDADGLLLGQGFLKRFRSWSIDNQRQVLLLR